MKECPKCKSKLDNNWKIKKGQKGCEYCNPTCRYCGKHYNCFLSEHYQVCKVFQKEIKDNKNKLEETKNKEKGE